ncbi:MAG: Spy/CpxP family protein refolding chaperone, partial [Candidatus Marinimicrobia bacterium]|nr:Spy/CpxP family protein refolding chaperone [Candidatus Neomarinimicrobiota bacterium]MCF7830348.1 Spy/CpxP family protein refolding chaperone [Candidatus Neomarinimicrobiota bacterium]MCF7882416.1 Spy/CpxP family protein refolding chaperone [Candidatus Neomarinimicrobiota bacterium]
MKRTALILIIAGALATPFFLGTGFAQEWGGMHGNTAGNGYGMMNGGHMGGHMGAGHMMNGMQGNRQNVPDQYRLSEKQQTKIDDIRDAYQEELTPLIEQLRETRREYATALNSNDIDADRLEQLRAEVNSIQDKIQEQRVESRKQVNTVLTDDQLAYYGNHHGFLMGSEWQNM